MDTNSLNKVVDSILAFLNAYGSAILNKSFEVVLKQVYASAISDIVWGFFCLIIVIITLAMLKSWWSSYVENCKDKAKEYRENSSYANWRNHIDSDDLIFPVFIGSIFTFLPGAIMIFLVNGAIMKLYNPEWFAIQMILTLVK